MKTPDSLYRVGNKIYAKSVNCLNSWYKSLQNGPEIVFYFESKWSTCSHGLKQEDNTSNWIRNMLSLDRSNIIKKEVKMVIYATVSVTFIFRKCVIMCKYIPYFDNFFKSNSTLSYQIAFVKVNLCFQKIISYHSFVLLFCTINNLD